MTIHSDWGKLFHEECPDAFTMQAPTDIKWGVGVIDGHLQLMCLNSNFVSWDKFITIMYINPIQKLFRMGCPKVVVCFDNYENVPIYKNITQNKRCKGKEIAVFTDKQSLPPIIPSDTMLFLMNRHFKVKLVHFICSRLPSMIQLEKDQELIIDYKSVVVYKHESDMAPLSLSAFHPMGESDVKFIRYVKSMGNALIHAVDGDYMIIALLYYCENSITDTNNIFILRQQSTLKSVTEHALGHVSCAKRKRTVNHTEQVKNKRVKWWVNMQLIYASFVSSGVSVWRKGESDYSLLPDVKHIVETMLFLVLLAGSDFSRALPLLGPKRIWDYWPQIFGELSVVLDHTKDENFIVDVIINSMYKTLWSKHIGYTVARNSCWNDTYAYLSRCASISESMRKRIPNKDQLFVTIRNIKWLVDYWKTDNNLVLTPLDGSNGFSRDQSTSRIVFSDTVNC